MALLGLAYKIKTPLRTTQSVLLILLCLGILPLISLQEDTEECKIIPGSMSLPVLQKEGDIILGGLFSLHDMVTEPSLSFGSAPSPTLCTR